MNIPKYLYKYRSLHTKKDREHTLRILSHNEIYFTKCKEFNDPFDCNLHISVHGDCNTHKVKLRQLNPDLSDEELISQTLKDLQPKNIKKCELRINNEIRRINKNIGIFSMSAKRDNLLMWSHYANFHKGICLEFKTINGKLFGCEILNVDYEKKYPNLSMYDNPNFEWVKKYLTTKSLDWEYEEEWRIIYKKTGCQAFLSEDNELSGVILGSHISKRNKESVLKCLSENNCEVKLYQAHECKDRFGLNIIPME